MCKSGFWFQHFAALAKSFRLKLAFRAGIESNVSLHAFFKVVHNLEATTSAEFSNLMAMLRDLNENRELGSSNRNSSL